MNWNTVLHHCVSGNPEPDQRLEKALEDWKRELDPEVFRITRMHGTERAFSSEMCSRFEPGQYHCTCCDTLLFDAESKFESGTGWPSYHQPAKPNAIAYHKDTSYGMIRVETLCNTCQAHLGHVFPDGPEPTGLRYCINALALKKKA